MKHIKKRLTYANVMSSIAVFLVLGGATAIAAGLAKNSVGTKQLKKNAVTTAKIKKNAVTGAKVKNGSLTGSDINLGTLGTVPSAASAATAASAGNADTVDGQHVVKIYNTLSPGQTEVPVASAGGFTITATCEGNNVDVRVHSPAGPAWVINAGGIPGGAGANKTTFEYESGVAGETGNMYIDNLSEGGDAGYGISSLYAVTSAGTVVSGTIGYDYDSLGETPPDICLVTGHLTVG
ncbi:MAG TPA: hypothetical protein VGV69_06720 [Solirubrobacterales bacterium]|nr:hypothetical protein [Solirubrobacterales bacterium]